jgi:FKBP-type peptidyl-prolyl cis-trans isomerase
MRFCRFLLIFALTIAPLVSFGQRERLSAADLELVNKTWPNAKKTSTGIRYLVLAEGQGELAKPGDLVTVHYAGWLLDGTLFDKVMDPEPGLKFRMGRHNVIEGWDQGLQLMRPGGRYVLIIPSELAYGSRGKPPVIPPNSTLVFEVHLEEAKK